MANTPSPCDICKNLYTNCLYEDDETYTSECKKKLEMGNKNCKLFKHYNEK